MMLDIKLAKSLMENEEGMNHLWIRFVPDTSSPSAHVWLHIELPQGVYRTPNLNGCEEKDSRIKLDLSKNSDVLIEVYTQKAIECGHHMITITLAYRDEQKREIEVIRHIPLSCVEDEAMHAAVIDEQVVERLKELSRDNSRSDSHEQSDQPCFQPRTFEIRNEFAYLEEKYRIEY